MEALHQSETDGRLPQDAQDRLDQFKAFAARHPVLDQVEHEVLHAIWEPAGCASLLVARARVPCSSWRCGLPMASCSTGPTRTARRCASWGRRRLNGG
jgi:hypothetical protein